jgi:hypothetical protein
MIYKLLDSDDSEFLDTDESSDTDCGEQEDDKFLLDTGDNSSVSDTAYVSGNNFLREDVDNYIRQQETSGGISGNQDSAMGLPNAEDKFEQFFDKDIL